MNLSSYAIPVGLQVNNLKSSHLYVGNISYFFKRSYILSLLSSASFWFHHNCLFHIMCISLYLDFSSMNWHVQNCSMYMHALVCLYHKVQFTLHWSTNCLTLSKQILDLWNPGGAAAIPQDCRCLTTCHTEYVTMYCLCVKLWNYLLQHLTVSADLSLRFIFSYCWFVEDTLHQFLSLFESVCKPTCKSDKED